MKQVDRFVFDDVHIFRFGFSSIGRPKMFVHMFFVDGLLIDTGQPIMGKEILESTKDLDIEKIVLTHHHEDHSGNLALLKNHFKCPILASKRCIELMKCPPKLSLAQKLVWGTRGPFYDLEPIGGMLESRTTHFEIIPIPGHAEDMIALYEPNKKWLFSADLYVNSYIGYFVRNESVKQQIDSLKTVLELDFDLLFCSHNPQFEGGKQALQKKLDFLEDFYQRVIDMYQKGFSENEIFRRMKLKERWDIRLLSAGHLSKLNMVRSAIRDYSLSITDL